MKSSQDLTRPEVAEHGRAIARAMDDYKVQKEKNMAKAQKRSETMLKRAAEAELGRNYK